jgi:predicted RNase H-like HicB family nuclease
MAKKTLNDYRRLPYSRRCQLIVEEGERFWHAWIEELPGCEIDGQTKAGAYLALSEVFDDYVSTKLEWGSAIPEPERWPKLHKARRSKKTKATVEVVRTPAPPRQYISGLSERAPTDDSLVTA